MSHDRVTLVDAASTYAGGAFDAIIIGNGATAKDITAEIRGARLGRADRNARCDPPGLQDTLDTLAAGLRDG